MVNSEKQNGYFYYQIHCLFFTLILIFLLVLGLIFSSNIDGNVADIAQSLRPAQFLIRSVIVVIAVFFVPCYFSQAKIGLRAGRTTGLQ